MKANLLFAALVLTTVTSFAQTSTTSTLSLPKSKFAVMLDGGSVIMGGFGVKATTALSEKLSVGLLAQRMKLNTDKDSTIVLSRSKHDITRFGIISDYYLSGSNTESGVYGSAALVYSKVQTDVTILGEELPSDSDSTIGPQVKLGYQIVSRTAFFPNDIILQLGLGYGSAGSVSWRYSSTNGDTGESKTELKTGLLLDLSAGVTF